MEFRVGKQYALDGKNFMINILIDLTALYLHTCKTINQSYKGI